MKLTKSLKEVIIKSLIFIGLFILFSIVIGTQLYQYGLLDKWKLEIYGRLGYIILFSLLGFILVYKEKLKTLKSYPFQLKDGLLGVFSVILLLAFYFFQINAYRFEPTLLNIILVHILGLSMFVFLALGVYGVKFVHNFVLMFKKELGYFLAFGALMYPAMNFIWGIWPFLSLIVLKIVSFMLTYIGDVTIVGSDILIYNGFAVKIAEACSGVFSIFLFSTLYIFAVFLDFRKLNLKKVILLFIPAVIGAFFVNVLRVFLLMVIGAHISPAIALGLYHSYTGMVFFLIYFGVFWLLLYKWLCKK